MSLRILSDLPTYDTNCYCCVCAAFAVSLNSGDAKILWCENGHVVVTPGLLPEVTVFPVEFRPPARLSSKFIDKNYLED
jgi:hypothetical protein